MRIQLIQKDVGTHSLTSFVQSAASAAIDLVCFPELALSGCLYEAPERFDSAEYDGQFDRSSEGLALMAGVPVSQNGRLYNSYRYQRGEERHDYHKVNLFSPFNEDRVYAPGTEIGLMSTSLGKLGVAICYDIRFPELFDQLKRAGAQLIVVPAAFPRVRVDQWRKMLIERAIQVQLPVLGINAVGNDGVNEFGGRSAAIGSDGSVIAEAEEAVQEVLTVEIEL